SISGFSSVEIIQLLQIQPHRNDVFLHSILNCIRTVLPPRENPQTPDMRMAVVMETGYSTAFWG
ncbi:hypothetical protein AVEN_123102-1, partial [Araneus ventricosus]